MLRKFIVSGKSMEPKYKEGSYVITTSLLKPNIGDSIVFKKNKTIFIKKIKSKNNNNFYVISENKKGINSEKLGLIKENEILGKVILGLKF